MFFISIIFFMQLSVLYFYYFLHAGYLSVLYFYYFLHAGYLSVLYFYYFLHAGCLSVLYFYYFLHAGCLSEVYINGKQQDLLSARASHKIMPGCLFDPCQGHMCQRGRCKRRKHKAGYRCKCKRGYSGIHCDKGNTFIR